MIEDIKQAIEKFIKGGDNSDPSALEEILHPQYQNIQDGFFEKPGIFVISKENYVQLVRDKVFGGKPRDITYHSIEQKNNIAYATVSLESPTHEFSSLITCVQEEGKWRIITNLPSIKTK
ncbi:nuclear transport factor 2 family protein [Chryseobacterium sp. JK1]|uniref:nuclear transport factor 2 family protein n=1 Tax=Chryseobacterium sp. JK1 TaxID=874294 RepID=UPI003D6957A8